MPRDLYPSAVAWRSSTWQLAAVLGPAVGGLVYGFSGPATAYGVDAALMASGVIAAARIFHAPRAHPPSNESVSQSLAGGVRFVRSQPVILGALTLDLFSVFFGGGATALLPVFAAEILHVGPQGLGLLRAAPAAGAVTMSLRGHDDRVRAVEAVRALAGVSSVNAIFIGSSNEVGAFESGVTARLLGTVVSVVLGGLATLGVVALTAVKVPELRRLRAIRQ